MTQLRKWLFAAMAALALAAPAMTPSPARANSPAAAPGQQQWYHVYVRADPGSPWTDVGAYDNSNDAQTVAAYLSALGFDAFVG